MAQSSNWAPSVHSDRRRATKHAPASFSSARHTPLFREMDTSLRLRSATATVL